MRAQGEIVYEFYENVKESITVDMYMAIFVTGWIGFGLNKALGATERRFVHWRGK